MLKSIWWVYLADFPGRKDRARLIFMVSFLQSHGTDKRRHFEVKKNPRLACLSCLCAHFPFIFRLREKVVIAKSSDVRGGYIVTCPFSEIWSASNFPICSSNLIILFEFWRSTNLARYEMRCEHKRALHKRICFLFGRVFQKLNKQTFDRAFVPITIWNEMKCSVLLFSLAPSKVHRHKVPLPKCSKFRICRKNSFVSCNSDSN